MSEPQAAPRPEGLPIALAFAALFALYVAISWAQWPLLTADSARELYVPFHIRHGALIYRDFHYLYGPLAPYAAAGLLALFGEHLAVLYVANLALLALTLALLYGLARQLLSPWLSAAVVLIFFSHFALGRDIWGYVWPYAAAATWGVALGLGGLLAIARHLKTGQLHYLALAGLLTGLSLVDKLEYGFAAGVLGLAYGLYRALTAGSWRAWASEALAFGLPLALASGLVAWLVLSHVPLATVLESIWPVALMKLWNSAGAWHGNPASWLNNAKWLAFDALVLATAIGHPAIARHVRTHPRERLVFGAVALGAVALAVRYHAGLGFFIANAPTYWMGPGFALLLGILGRVAWRALQAWKRGEAAARKDVLWGGLALYGCAISFRTLFTGYNDYTRYQAPVALIAWVAFAAHWLPAWARDRGWLDRPRASYGALVLVLSLLSLAHLAGAARDYTSPHLAVSGPHGTVMAQADYALPFSQATRFLREHTHPGDPLVVAPMEASLFTFTGCENALREDNMFYGYLTTPTEQSNAIQTLQARHVRYIVLSNYGWVGKRFGVDYMQALARWIETRCQLVADYGGPGYRLRIFETPAATRAHPR